MPLSVKLKNNTRNTSKIGCAVIVDPSDRSAFIYAPANATEILGIVAQSVRYREICEIITSGEVLVFVQGNPRKGDVIRSRITNDNLPSGACKVAKTGDVPFPQVGIALETGIGLIRCRLLFIYHMSEDPFNIADYVPYVGATKDVDLGTHAISAGSGVIGSDADYAGIGSDGTLTFVGAAGLPHGEFHGENISQTVVIAVANTAYEVNISGLTGGLLKLVTFSTHFLKVTVAGIYSVHWSMTLDTTTSQDEIEGGLMINGVAVSGKGTSHTTIAVVSAGASLGAHALLDLAVDDEVSLYVRNHTEAEDAVIEHLACTLVMIAGT